MELQDLGKNQIHHHKKAKYVLVFQGFVAQLDIQVYPDNLLCLGQILDFS